MCTTSKLNVLTPVSKRPSLSLPECPPTPKARKPTLSLESGCFPSLPFCFDVEDTESAENEGSSGSGSGSDKDNRTIQRKIREPGQSFAMKFLKSSHMPFSKAA